MTVDNKDLSSRKTGLSVSIGQPAASSVTSASGQKQTLSIPESKPAPLAASLNQRHSLIYLPDEHDFVAHATLSGGSPLDQSDGTRAPRPTILHVRLDGIDANGPQTDKRSSICDQLRAANRIPIAKINNRNSTVRNISACSSVPSSLGTLPS